MTINKKLALESIFELLEACWDVFGEKDGDKSPLYFYYSIAKRINDGKVEKIDVGTDNCIDGFKRFFDEYGEFLDDTKKMMDAIPRGTNINYGNSDRIYLEIQRYLFQSNKQDREVLREYLITIHTIINPSEENLNILDNAVNIDQFGMEDGAEKDFMTNIIGKAQNAMKDIDTDDPTQAVMGLLSSGIINDVMKGVQDMSKGDNGMDIGKLMGSMQNAMSMMMPEGATSINDIVPPNIMKTVKKSIEKEQNKVKEIESFPGEGNVLGD